MVVPADRNGPTNTQPANGRPANNSQRNHLCHRSGGKHLRMLGHRQALQSTHGHQLLSLQSGDLRFNLINFWAAIRRGCLLASISLGARQRVLQVSRIVIRMGVLRLRADNCRLLDGALLLHLLSAVSVQDGRVAARH